MKKQDPDYKFGFVSLLGRANVGKSTLLNKLVGQSVSIVSNKPQTTRRNLKGICSTDKCQIVFIDTPGVLKPTNPLQKKMLEQSQQGFYGVDLILYVSETLPFSKQETELHPIDAQNIQKLPPDKTILVLNKTDLASQETILKSLQFWSKKFPALEFIPVSALKDKKLDKLKILIEKYLPKQPAHYPSDWIVDSNFFSLAAEFVREQTFRILMQEVPYGITTITEKIEQKENCLKIFVCIYCTKINHKKMIIGKDGEILKKIGTRARIKLEHFCKQKVFLSLYVKQKENWQNQYSFLKEIFKFYTSENILEKRIDKNKKDFILEYYLYCS